MIRAMALRILRQAGAPSRDRRRQVRAIQRWIQREILFIPEAGDVWYTPIRTLWIGGGDCDDHAIVLASLLESLRIPTSITILRRDGRGFHVYVRARIDGSWVPAETTIRAALGWDPRTIGSRVEDIA